MTISHHHLKLGEGDGDGDSISEKGLNNAASVWESVSQDHHFHVSILNSYKWDILLISIPQSQNKTLLKF